MQQVAGYPDPLVIADNGFIDLLVNTGYLGLALFSIFYGSLWWRALRLAWSANDVYGLVPLIVLAYVLVANLTWSLLFENESFFMLTMIAIWFSIPAPASRRKPARSTRPAIETSRPNPNGSKVPR